MSLQFKIILSLLFVFIILSGVAVVENHTHNKAFVERVVMEQTTSIADQYFDSVNTLMITGSMDQREILRQKFEKEEAILEARIFRSQIVKNDFGDGFDYESPKNEKESHALLGNPYGEIESKDNKRFITVMRPFRASQNYKGTNCLECHVSAKEGDVLGVVKIRYDLDKLDSEIYSNSQKTAKNMVLLFIAALVGIAFLIKIVVVNRVKKLNNVIRDIHNNMDLTLRVPKTVFSDEISSVSNSMNSMLSTFQELINSIGKKSSILLDGANDVDSISKDNFDNINKLQDETNNISQAVTEMAETSRMVASNSEQTKSAVILSSETITKGANNAKVAREKIDSLTKQIEEVSRKVESLKISGDEIMRILALINDITMKTQHLSINAAVEAARAGEHGKGFVVVAEKIGELARETKTSTTNIRNITDQIQSLIAEVAEITTSTKEHALEGNDLVVNTSNSFEIVKNEMQKASSLVADISSATVEQASASREISNNIKEVMALNITSTQGAESISNLGEEFKQLADEISEIVGKFKA